MNKYKRSIEKLSALIKEVFGVYYISVDTKAIVLILAGTLPSKRFVDWLDKIDALNPLNCIYKQINALRCQGGECFRNYIILSALQAVEHDVSGDELQRFIDSAQEVEHKLTIEEVDLDSLDNTTNFATVELSELARTQLLKNTVAFKYLNNNVILDAYLYCRNKSDSSQAYSAVLQAMVEIFVSSNFRVNDAVAMSRKIMRDTLTPFAHNVISKDLLYRYAPINSN